MDLFSRSPQRPARSSAGAGTADNVMTVSQLTVKVREALERQIGTVWVEGEMSNFRRQSSGHCYFTLKDAGAQLQCVLFRGDASFVSAPLADGLHIQAHGAMSVYDARGQYQMIVRRVRQGGLGALQAKFEALKQRLAAEGLFDSARKRAIPRSPRVIGIVTSPTGAAIQDMLNILSRRAPWVHVLIWPARVQGTGAEEEIAAGVRGFGRAEELGLPVPDTIVVARGGGSLEDLWAFNEETLARAIAASPVPVVSAVGHEIDFTIADFTADLRAPTPSAAAELIVPDRAELQAQLKGHLQRLRRSAEQTVAAHQRILELTARALPRDPDRIILPWQQRLDGAEENLRRALQDTLSRRQERIHAMARRLDARRPDRVLAEQTSALGLLRERLATRTRATLENAQSRLNSLRSLLRSLGPDSVLSRGFSYTVRADGQPVTSASDLRKGDSFTVRLAKGRVRGTVDDVEQG